MTDNGKRAPQLVGFHQTVGNIHCDDDVGAQIPGNADGQVVGDAPIHQQLAITFHRRVYPGNTHAGTDGLGEVTVTDDHLLTGLEIGGNRPEGNGEPVEVFNQGGVVGQLVEDKT